MDGVFVSGRRGGKATQRPGDRTKGSEREKTLQRGTDNEISAHLSRIPAVKIWSWKRFNWIDTILKFLLISFTTIWIYMVSIQNQFRHMNNELQMPEG